MCALVQGLAEQLRKALEEHGVVDAELLEIYLDEDESPESLAPRQLLHDAGLRFTQVNCWFGGDSDEGTVKRVSIEWSLTYRYMRGVAKLGFHYFMWSSSAYRGDENQFSGIRAFIRNGQGDWRQFVNPFASTFVPQIENRVGPMPRHFLASQVTEREVVVRTHLFVGPTIPPASVIRLGPSPQRIAGETITAHEVIYYDQKQREASEGYVGEIVGAEAGASRIIRVVPKWPTR